MRVIRNYQGKAYGATAIMDRRWLPSGQGGDCLSSEYLPDVFALPAVSPVRLTAW
jgi:hypothetical protein